MFQSLIVAALAAIYCIVPDPAEAHFLVPLLVAAGMSTGMATVAVVVAQVAVVAVASSVAKRRAAARRSAVEAQRNAQEAATVEARGAVSRSMSQGGANPMTFIVGSVGVGGQLEAPHRTFPERSDPPFKYLSMVISISDLPGVKLSGRIGINDEWHNFAGALPAQSSLYAAVGSVAGLGQTVTGKYANKVWVRYHDGSQTAADGLLLSGFSSLGATSDPSRPWSGDMVGRGICYAVVTMEFDTDLFTSAPSIMLETANGVPLYDIRKDSSVGGNGAQRWSDRATWEPSDNPKVIEYNIRRGIKIDGMGTWGGGALAADLPFENWATAMNECDALVANGAGGSERQFIVGMEISLDERPSDVIEEINRSCMGETVEVGGVFKTRVGGPGLPVFFITDDDILVTRPQELEPFTGLDETFNAIGCTYPDPSLLYDTRDAPMLTNADWELEDGSIEYDEEAGGFARQPRRLPKAMRLRAVTRMGQVQRLMEAVHRQSRRRQSHVITLPPAGLALEPLDVISWTSAHNGFAAKSFDIIMTVDPITEMRPRVGLLEVDHDDFTAPEIVAWDAVSKVSPVTAPDLLPDRPVVTERLVRNFSGGYSVSLTIDILRSVRPDAQYHWQRLIDGTWADEKLSGGTAIVIDNAALGPWQMRVRTIAGRSASAWREFDFSVMGTKAPPAALTGLTCRSIGGLALITWDLHPDLDVQQGGVIVIRHSSSAVPKWCETIPMQKVGGNTTSTICELIPGAYFVRAVDESGNLGPISAISTEGVQVLPFAAVDILQADNEFLGQHDGTIERNGELALQSIALLKDWGALGDLGAIGAVGGIVPTATYTFATAAAFDAIKLLRLRSEIEYRVLEWNNAIGQRDAVGTWPALATSVGALCDIEIEVQTTKDDASDPQSIWADWSALRSAEVVCRGLRARAKISTANPTFEPRIQKLRLKLDEVTDGTVQIV